MEKSFPRAQDITERKQTEAYLQRMAVVFSDFNEAIIVQDLDGIINAWNRGAENMYGYSEVETLGMNIFKFVPKEKRREAFDLIEQIKTGESVESIETKRVAKDGRIFDVLLTLTKLVDDEGNVVAVATTERDITERKKLEKELMRLFIAINTSTDSIVISDIDAKIIDVNEATRKMYGTDDKEDLIGKYVFDLLVPEEREKVLEGIAFAVVEKGYVKSQEYNIITKDGSKIPVDMSTAIMKDLDNKLLGLVCVIRDITERKQHEHEQQRILEELERSNRELDDYTYAVSHDLKAPLRSLISFSEFLLEDYADKLDETGQEYLKYIMDSSMQMNRLIQDLLVLSRVGRKYTETDLVDLNELMEEIKLDFKAQLEEKKVEFLVNQLPPVKTQRVWMKQILVNLIDNGLKFNKSPIPAVEVSCEDRQGDYLFTVRDNGIGIREVDQKLLFKLFQRLHPEDEYPGTGVGLALCKKIVDTFGGEIWVESKPDKGSTFHFTYPTDKISEEASAYQS